MLDTTKTTWVFCSWSENWPIVLLLTAADEMNYFGRESYNSFVLLKLPPGIVICCAMTQVVLRGAVFHRHCHKTDLLIILLQ